MRKSNQLNIGVSFKPFTPHMCFLHRGCVYRTDKRHNGRARCAHLFYPKRGEIFFSLPLRNLFIFFIKFPFIRIFSRPEEGVFSFDRYTCFLAPISIGISMCVGIRVEDENSLVLLIGYDQFPLSDEQ